MLKSLSFKITGVSPLVMHNGQLSDPLNDFSRAIKRLSSKRNKTEADHEEIGRLEWYGSLYLQDGRPCIPGAVLEAALTAAARKSKNGKQAQAGILCPDNFILDIGEFTSIDDLWAGKKHLLRASVVIKGQRVIRTRPKFDNWSADVEVQFDDEALNPNSIREFMAVAGSNVGLMDWRPKFGRFDVSE